MDLPYLDEEWIQLQALYGRDLVFLEAFSVDDDDVVQRAIGASNVMNGLLMPYIIERRGGDGDDLISRLWRGGAGAINGWDEIDMRANVRIIFFGGSDTTTHVLANAFYVLMTDRELAASVRDGGNETIVGSSRRPCGSTGRSIRPRVANYDVELAGCPIGADERLLTVNLAANRDPAHTRRPTTCDSTARPLDHLAFHSGREPASALRLLGSNCRSRSRRFSIASPTRGLIPTEPPRSKVS